MYLYLNERQIQFKKRETVNVAEDARLRFAINPPPLALLTTGGALPPAHSTSTHPRNASHGANQSGAARPASATSGASGGTGAGTGVGAGAGAGGATATIDRSEFAFKQWADAMRVAIRMPGGIPSELRHRVLIYCFLVAFLLLSDIFFLTCLL